MGIKVREGKGGSALSQAVEEPRPKSSTIFLTEGGEERLARLLARRKAEDELQVCMQRAEILQRAQAACAQVPRVPRQAAVIRELCRGITPVIEPEDVIVGRMPEVVPDEEGEAFIARHPEFFSEPGLPGCLDSMSIFVPDWAWLLERGLGGIAEYARHQRDAPDVSDDERTFLSAVGDAMESLSCLVGRYAAEARRLAGEEPSPERRAELEAIAGRCDRVARRPPAGFIEALQLIQIVHMALSCLVGGRDVTPGRVDQYLWEYYRRDLEDGEISEGDAVALLAMFFLRLSQMTGHGTDYDDNVRRTPCKYSHLYATVGGTDARGRSCVNGLSFASAAAIRLLKYKEPTLLVRYHAGMDRAFVEEVAGLVRDRLPVTIYNDETVTKALVSQGVPEEAAHEYAHSACHNSIVPGHEAGSGPGGFHNVPRLILLAMNGGRDPKSGKMLGAATAGPGDIRTFEQFLDAFRGQVAHYLAGVRKSAEERWQRHLSPACPLLPSCLMKFCLDRRKPAWQAATISHMNHYFMGVATTVDALLAIRHLVFDERNLGLEAFVRMLADDWAGNGALRERIRRRLPRYGQDREEPNALASRIGGMWVEEVEAASAGMARMAMWPGFYSHLAHVRQGTTTMATPDGRKAGEALSENLAPSTGSTGCSPTSILKTMSHMPFDHTPSGAAILTLSQNAFSGSEGAGRLLSLMETYFEMGGLHLHVNALDVETLTDAMRAPDQYRDLMVRVAGFSAYFVYLTRETQLDVVRRHQAVS